jgi:hypothetical protein
MGRSCSFALLNETKIRTFGMDDSSELTQFELGGERVDELCSMSTQVSAAQDDLTRFC